MSRHGRAAPPPLGPDDDVPAERRWGLLTGETALVLALIAVIVAGTFLVNAIQPSSSRTNTVYGKTTMQVHNLGKGGIQPGVVTPRKIVVAPPVIAPAGPTPIPTLAPPTGTTPTTAPTKAPTATPTKKPGGGVLTPPSGGGGGGGGGCTLIIVGCDPADQDTHQPSAEPTKTTTKPAPTATPTP